MEIESKTFPIIPEEEFTRKYIDHEFWYVEDPSREDDEIILTPIPGIQGDLLLLFTDKEDAEHYRHLVSKATVYQDDRHKIGRPQAEVKSTKWQVMDLVASENWSEWVGIDHNGAVILFELMKAQVPLTEAEEKQLHDAMDDDETDGY